MMKFATYRIAAGTCVATSWEGNWAYWITCECLRQGINGLIWNRWPLWSPHQVHKVGCDGHQLSVRALEGQIITLPGVCRDRKESLVPCPFTPQEKIVIQAKLVLVPFASICSPAALSLPQQPALPSPRMCAHAGVCFSSSFCFPSLMPWAYSNTDRHKLAKLVFYIASGCGWSFFWALIILSGLQCHSPKEWWCSGHWTGWQRSQF